VNITTKSIFMSIKVKKKWNIELSYAYHQYNHRAYWTSITIIVNWHELKSINYKRNSSVTFDISITRNNLSQREKKRNYNNITNKKTHQKAVNSFLYNNRKILHSSHVNYWAKTKDSYHLKWQPHVMNIHRNNARRHWAK
jgi:hypothetical protein